MSRHLVVALSTAPMDGATIAALRLAEAALERGNTLSVYAYGPAVRIAADDAPTSEVVRALLGRGSAGTAAPERARWVVDADDPRAGDQIPGVVVGDGSDLWRMIRDADVVLGVSP